MQTSRDGSQTKLRQRDWKEDGSDLMEEAELFYKEAKQTNKWGKKVPNADTMYAFQATTEDDEPEEERNQNLIRVINQN